MKMHESVLEKVNLECLEYHYLLLKEPCTKQVFSSLCKKFSNYGSLGETFLLRKLETETDSQLKGTVLQILGKLKYTGGKQSEETAKVAREYLVSEDSFLRNRASIVLGWVGNENDIDILEERIKLEENIETRGWLCTSLMQLFFNNESVEKHKTRLLKILRNALIQEQNEFVTHCILVSIQEISKINLGISSTSHAVLSGNKIAKAKRKALERLSTES